MQQAGGCNSTAEMDKLGTIKLKKNKMTKKNFSFFQFCQKLVAESALPNFEVKRKKLCFKMQSA